MVGLLSWHGSHFWVYVLHFVRCVTVTVSPNQIIIIIISSSSSIIIIISAAPLVQHRCTRSKSNTDIACVSSMVISCNMMLNSEWISELPADLRTNKFDEDEYDRPLQYNDDQRNSNKGDEYLYALFGRALIFCLFSLSIFSRLFYYWRVFQTWKPWPRRLA